MSAVALTYLIYFNLIPPAYSHYSSGFSLIQ